MGRCIGAGTGGHDIVDQGNVATADAFGQARRYPHGLAQIGLARHLGQAHLVRRVEPSLQHVWLGRDRQAVAHFACQLPGLVVAAFAQALRTQRHRQQHINRLGDGPRKGIDQPLRQGARQFGLLPEFEARDQAVPGEAVVQGRHRSVERRWFAQALAADI